MESTSSPSTTMGNTTTPQQPVPKSAPQAKVGLDYPTWKLFSTPNTFTITPSTMFSVQRSLIIDKRSIKIKEHGMITRLFNFTCIEIVVRDDAEWAIEIQGLLGILNILGIEHLMVIVGKEEVCKIPHKLQANYKQPSVIFELQEVELIPFLTTNSPQLEYQLKSIRDGIKKFLECGFYLSYRFDLTSNAQRRERLLVPKDGSQDFSKVHPLYSIDYRYMWNYNIYKQLRTQHIPSYWMVPLVQGYVGHARLNDIEMILIARRRWLMGGTRFNSRGIDEEGNTANCVETEQIVMRHVPKETHDRLYTYSFAQVRGSVPFFWQQESGKINIHRSLESSVDAFKKHCESLIEDYEGNSTLMINLLCKTVKDEEELTKGLIKLKEDTSEYFVKQGKKVDYEYFDFHQNCKKGTGLLDTFIQDILKNSYLRDMGIFCEKHSVYKHKGKFVRESRKIQSIQSGVTRTNCLDCLDRTNVFQSKVALKVFEDVLKQYFLQDSRLQTLLTNMWAFCGDFISKIYAGTHSVLTQVTIKGKENMFDKIDHGVTSVRRFIKQNLSDDFKQECILVLQGQHELCNSMPANFVESVVVKEIDTFSEDQKIILHITTLNCAGRSPASYEELIPIFRPQIDGPTPDILVIGLQEIVKLNSFSIFQGKNTAKMAEWERLLRQAIEKVSNTKDPDERYVWVIAKSMVGCFIGLFVKQKLLSRIKELKTTKIKTGLGGSAGNKGAVIVRFKLDDTSVLLMNCHLMSGKNKGSKRTDELNFIFDNAFKSDSKNRRFCIENHQMVFIFGDLNYRICLPNDVVRKALHEKDFSKLKDADELLQAFKVYQGSKELQYQFYREFEEGEINFDPTYKYDKHSQKYDTSKKQRVPSWCDRILWKKNPKVQQQILGCIQNMTFSDHRPVFSQFQLFASKIMSDLTNKMEEKFFENMRFQSLYVFGKKRISDTRGVSETLRQEEDVMDDEERKSLDTLDEQLNRYSQNSEQRHSENPLVPLIEEGDEEEVDPNDHQFIVNTVTNGEDHITAVGKTHKGKKDAENGDELERENSSDMVFDENHSSGEKRYQQPLPLHQK